ncbi:MAG: transposase [Bacteroidales bacterium]|nr:transposase [Bacteroidales bacterium]
MIEDYPVNITTVARVLGFKPKTLYGWYRNYLSDYNTDKEQGRWDDKKVDVVDEQTGEILKQKTIYIAKPENVGFNMCLDDKEINHKSFTILSNQDTGKIAFAMDSVKGIELKKGIKFLGKCIQNIKSISCDMAPSYLNFCKTILPLALIIIDKFHVMKYVYDAVQSVRMQIRKDIFEQIPRGKRQKKDERLLTELEQLKKSKILLSKSKCQWNDEQSELMKTLFEKYPTLEIAYNLAQDFKKWYHKSNVKKPRLGIEKELFLWYEKVEKSKIKEFEPCVKMIEKHEENIINYFYETQTNAKAERLNGKIERFISNNYGVRDLDFSMYRIAGYFS